MNAFIVTLCIISFCAMYSYNSNNSATLLVLSKETTQNLKGILAVLIVLYHTRVLESYIGCWGYIIVSIFFFLSGYGLMTSFISKGRNSYKTTFLSRRLLKILPPPLLVAAIYLLWALLFHKTNLDQCIFRFCETGMPPIGAQWYIVAILYFYVAFYIAISCTSNPKTVFFIVLILSLIYMGGIKLLEWWNLWWLSSFAFPIGILYKIYEGKVLALLQKYYITTLSILIVIISTLGATCYITEFNDILFALFNAIVTIPVIWCLYVGIFPDNKILAFLGLVSYEIYCVHDMFISFMYGRSIPSALYLIILYSATIISAYYIHKICNTLIK